MKGNAGRAARKVSIFDTTLRDGEQAPGNAMRPGQKLEIALRLEALGVDVIETGFPASSPSDYKATQLISQQLTSARFASFCRAVRSDVQTAVDAGGIRDHQIQVLCTGSDLHLEHKRGISRADAVLEVRDTMRFAASLGITDLSLGVEDATRGEPDLLHDLIEGALEGGATAVVLGDTSGCMVPAEYGDLVHRVRSWLPDHVVLSTHCHDDFGLAVANALAGIEAGADEVQATLAGIGERAGNTALEELAAVLMYKGERLGVSTSIKTEQLFAAYQVLADAIALPPARAKAVFGTNAFATQAGIHQAGMLRNPETYEYLEPAHFGRERSLLVGRHSGHAVLRYLLDQIDVPADEGLVAQLYEEYVAGRVGGECDDVEVLAERLAARFRTEPV
jgi:2-isopropylmalate synthase